MLPISRIYAINVALDCLRDGVGNGIQLKGVSYNLITIINGESVENYYEIIALEKTMLVKAAYEEIEMVRRLIMANIHKYKNIIKGAGEMDIYALDQACADIDKTIGYTRKIIIMIPSIAEKIKIDMMKENEKRKEIEELLRLIQIKNTNKYQDLE